MDTSPVTASSLRFLDLTADAQRTVTVTSLPHGQDVTIPGPTSSTRTAVALPTARAPGRADWTSHFSSRELFEKDWWPCFSWAPGGVKDPSGDSWTCGTDNDFYPFSFHVDDEAPAGEYVRVLCDRVSRHPSDVGKVQNLSWVGSEATTRRGWTSGYIEFCARFPRSGAGSGGWPALWLYAQQSGLTSGQDNTGPFTAVDATARASEIDLLEIFGTGRAEWTTSVHAGSPGSSSATNEVMHTGATDTGWHTWGCSWDPAKRVLDVYFDHQKVAGATPGAAAAFELQELCARLNYTVGGTTASWMPGPTSATPDSMYMDVSHVRHYATAPS